MITHLLIDFSSNFETSHIYHYMKTTVEPELSSDVNESVEGAWYRPISQFFLVYSLPKAEGFSYDIKHPYGGNIPMLQDGFEGLKETGF
jgi:hypothetical protein